ncbi:hypothetical protein PMEGAPR185_04820 [Priestia megaterium]
MFFMLKMSFLELRSSCWVVDIGDRRQLHLNKNFIKNVKEPCQAMPMEIKVIYDMKSGLKLNTVLS